MNLASDLVRVTAAPHPFKAASTFLELPAGLTVKEIIEVAQPDPVLLQHCHVEIDGVPLDPSKIHLIRPKAGHLVTVRVAPGGGKKKKKGGGGKNPLQIVLQVAVVAAGIALMVAAPYLSPLVTVGLGLALVAANVGIAMAFAPSVAGLGKMGGMGGMGGKLTPPTRVGGGAVTSPSVSDVRDSPSQFIEGARNSAQPWGIVPDVLGRHRMVPPYAAAPFTSSGGSNQTLHLMFAWTPGEVVVSDYRIGETPITEYEDVAMWTLSGTPGDNPSVFDGIYTNDVSEEVFSILLTQPAGYQQRTTAPNALAIWIDLTLPQGLVKFDDQGKRQPHQVIVAVRYRGVGSGTGGWAPPPVTSASFPMHWIHVESDHIRIEFEGMTTAALRHGIFWMTAGTGQWDVEVARGSADATSTMVFDQVGWSALRSATASAPVLFPVPLARTAVRIRASDQLNGVIDNFNAIVHRKALNWHGDTGWQYEATSNPAAMFRHVLQGYSNRRPVPDSQIDLIKLQQWSDFCFINGFECNMIVDFPTSVRELLSIICGTGRASLDNVDGKWSVVIDEPRFFPVQHFTPRNSKGFRAEKVFPDRAHAWRLRFTDREHNWRSAERIIYDEDYGPSNATKFEQHDLLGVTNVTQAVHLMTHQLRSQRLQPENWEIEVDFEHLVAQRGDLVLLTHDMLLVGLASGRIKSLTLGVGGEILDMTSDEVMPMEGSKAYGVSVRTVATVQVVSRVTTVAGDQTTVSFAPPLAAGTVAVGDLFGFGELGKETVRGQVKRIKRADDLAARLTLMPYTDALWNWALPADFDPGMTPLFTVPAPRISTVYTGGAALGREADATMVRVVIECVGLGRPDAMLEAQARPTTTGENYRLIVEVVARPAPNIIVLGGMRTGETWDLRVRWQVGPFQPGPWAYRSGVYVEGYDTATSLTIDNLTLSAFGGQALLRWDRPTDLDTRFGGLVHVRHSSLQVGATWASSTSIGQGVPALNQTVSLPLKGGTYLARVFDAVGRPGPVASVSTKQASATEFGLLLSFDEHPEWDGIHNGTEVGTGAGSVIETWSDGMLWSDGTGWVGFEAGTTLQLDGTFRPGVGGFGNLGDVATNGYYDFATVVDLGSIRRVRVTTRIVASSVNINDRIDSRLDLIDSWQDFDGGDDQAEADAQVWVRITDDAPGAATSEWAWIDDTNWTDGTGWQDSGGGATWKLHQRLDSAEFEARGFDFQLRMASKDPGFNVIVSELTTDFEEVV